MRPNWPLLRIYWLSTHYVHVDVGISVFWHVLLSNILWSAVAISSETWNSSNNARITCNQANTGRDRLFGIWPFFASSAKPKQISSTEVEQICELGTVKQRLYFITQCLCIWLSFIFVYCILYKPEWVTHLWWFLVLVADPCAAGPCILGWPRPRRHLTCSNNKDNHS